MKHISYFVAATAMLLAAACSRGGDVSVPADAIVSVGNEHLTRDELRRHLLPGIAADDSAAFARAYIRSWIDERLVAAVAATRLIWPKSTASPPSTAKS